MENKKNINADEEIFTINDDENADEEICNIGEENIQGNVIASFSFGAEDNSTKEINNSSEALEQSSASKSLIPFERIVRNEFLSGNNLTKNNNGAACIIDGEIADKKKGYMLRDSTVRKLNELRSLHPDVNICLSTIVDLAIDTYYKCIKEL